MLEYSFVGALAQAIGELVWFRVEIVEEELGSPSTVSGELDLFYHFVVIGSLIR